MGAMLIEVFARSYAVQATIGIPYLAGKIQTMPALRRKAIWARVQAMSGLTPITDINHPPPLFLPVQWPIFQVPA